MVPWAYATRPRSPRPFSPHFFLANSKIGRGDISLMLHAHDFIISRDVNIKFFLLTPKAANFKGKTEAFAYLWSIAL